MRFHALAIAIILAMTSATILARGDGYDRSYEANKRFRESQDNIHKKQQTEAEPKLRKPNAKSDANDKWPLSHIEKSRKCPSSAHPDK